MLHTTNPCIISSFIFLINILVGIYYKYYIYASLFVALFITSILFHSYSSFEYLTLDLIVVFSIFIYGGYILLQKINKNKYTILFICLLFLLSLYLFFYGYYSNQYCYDVNKQVANLYHVLLHMISSLGHILVVLL